MKKNKRNLIYLITVFLFFIHPTYCFACRGKADLARSWEDTSIVVSGAPKIVKREKRKNATYLTYEMDIESSYKGKKRSKISFIDPFGDSTAMAHITEGERYVLFIQTYDDRMNSAYAAKLKGREINTILREFKIDNNQSELEEAMEQIQEYNSMDKNARKDFLLNQLNKPNKYTESFIHREIIKNRVTEAIPYFQRKLTEESNEKRKLDSLSILRCLGYPKVKGMLLKWLKDDSYKKTDIINQLSALNDKSVIPHIYKYVNDKDEFLAIESCCALLQLGESNAVKLLLDKINTSQNPTNRYNAIHHLHFGYSGNFSLEEKTAINQLIRDKDTAVARVAKFLSDKWKLEKADSSPESTQSITTLKKYVDKAYTVMVKELGPPVDKTGYTIENAPTKGWNHHELFGKYPKNAKNKDAQIMEVTWDDDEFYIIACFHMVDSVNRCLVAKRIRKGVRF